MRGLRFYSFFAPANCLADEANSVDEASSVDEANSADVFSPVDEANSAN